jgi:hypothetical protein
MDAPTPPELAHLSRAELRDHLWKSFGGPEPVRPWPGPITEIYYGWSGLGRDANGVSLHSDRESWLRANGWGGDGEKEAGHYLFSVMEAEMGEVREEIMDIQGCG